MSEQDKAPSEYTKPKVAPVDPKVFDKPLAAAEKEGFKAQVVYGTAQPALRVDY